MSKVLLCHLIIVNDLDHDIPSTDLVPLVNEFLDVFPKDLPGDPPFPEIDFGIDLEPDIKQVSILLIESLQQNSKSGSCSYKISLIRVSLSRAYPLGTLQCCL